MQRGQVRGGRGPFGITRGVQRFFLSLQILAMGVRLLDRGVERRRRAGRVGHRVGEGDRLPERKPDRAGEHQLLFGGSILGRDEPLLGVLPLHLRPVGIDRRHQPGLAAIFGERGERLRGLEFGPHGGNTAVGCQRLQIEVRNGDHHQVTSIPEVVLGGAQVVIGLVQVKDALRIDHRLGDSDACVEHVERADDRGDSRKATEAQRCEVDDLAIGAEASGDVRQHRRERMPSIASEPSQRPLVGVITPRLC